MYWQGNPDPSFLLNVYTPIRSDVRVLMNELQEVAYRPNLSREDRLRIAELNHQIWVLTKGRYGMRWRVCLLPHAEAELMKMIRKAVRG